MKEIWKDIKDFENYYKISNTGKVKSVSRYVYNDSLKGKDKRMLIKERVLKTRINKNGYEDVQLYRNNKKHTRRIHRLVAENFIENKDIDKNVVNHIDGNKLNNNLSNLEWMSVLENNLHAIENNLHKTDKMEESLKKRRKPVAQIDKETDKIIKEYESAKFAAEELNIDRKGIQAVANGYRNSKTYKNFKWKYI
ncbi:HNH homing endonuclease [Staphylococcus phage Machias]|nr:HNH homing endonuclease [Staphylococcus phage Machias]